MGVVSVPSFAAAWTVYEPYTPAAWTTRYLNSANYVTSDAPLVMASTPVENGVATIQFTGARRGVELRMFVSDLAAEVPLYRARRR